MMDPAGGKEGVIRSTPSENQELKYFFNMIIFLILKYFTKIPQILAGLPRFLI